MEQHTVSAIVENKEKRAADLDQALSVAGTGWYNLKYSFVLSLFLVAVIVEPIGYSFVLPAAKCDLEMTDTQRGFIVSVPYIGIIITSFPWGYLVDTQGRKKVIIWSSMSSGVLAILAGFMPDLISFTVCKFLAALCFAGSGAIPYTFIGEITPQRDRDIILSVVNAMQNFGATIVPLLAWAILPSDFHIDFGMYDFRPWRLLNIVNGAFFLIAASLMTFGPESPKYLLGQGKHDEAMKVLQTIYVGNKGKSAKDFPIKCLNVEGITNSKTKSTFLVSLKEQTFPLLKPPLLKWIILNGFLLFGIFATINGLNVWIPDILNRVLTGKTKGKDVTACLIIMQRLNETVTSTKCDDHITESTYIIGAVANSVCTIVSIFGSSTVNIVGKKNLALFFYSLIGIFAILINFVTRDTIFTIFLSSTPIMSNALAPINAYSVEIFPTHLRGMAVGLTMMLGRLGSVVGGNIAGLLINFNCPSTFYVFGGLLIFCALLTFLLPKSKNPSMMEKAMVSRKK